MSSGEIVALAASLAAVAVGALKVLEALIARHRARNPQRTEPELRPATAADAQALSRQLEDLSREMRETRRSVERNVIQIARHDERLRALEQRPPHCLSSSAAS